MKRMMLVIVVLALTPPAIGAEKGAAPPVYQPVGAPADPKVDVRWNRYHDYAAATDIVKRLAAAHPELVKVESLGKSYGDREMWVMTITAPAPGKGKGDGDDGDAARNKPAMWIDGGIHANEVQSTEVVLYTAWYLAEMHGRNETIDRLLRERTFYLMPMMSPDSRDAHMHEPADTHSPRSGQRPFDDDRDGLTDEDGPDDLDGDGHITFMRVADPNGGMTPHEKYPGVMVRIDPENPPPADKRYTMLGIEGIDNDGDGRVNEDEAGEYDPNRNWPWQWEPDYVQRGAGRYPFSIEENRMVADFITRHPNISAGQSYHNAGGMILRGPGQPDRRYHPADEAVFAAIGHAGEQMLPGYRYMELAKDLYPGWGVEIDWLYGMRGVVAYTTELFTPFNYFRQPDEGIMGSEETRARFNRLLLQGEGTVPWHAVDHPQFGKIEVGGYKKSWVRQPPSFMLEEECHRNMSFTLYHADQLPRVKVQSVTSRKLAPGDGGVREITAIIENSGAMPTRLMHDVDKGITPPDRVAIAGEGVEPIVALVSNDRFFKRAREQKRNPADVRVNRIDGRDVVYVRWLVTGDGPVSVTVRSVHGGADTMAVVAKP